MRHRIPLSLILGLALLLSASAFPFGVASPLRHTICGYGVYNPFATGNCISHTFHPWWETNGNVPILGLPIRAERTQVSSDGRSYLTQWFERERLEYHPENGGSPYVILLGLLGVQVLQSQGRDPAGFPPADPGAPHYFPATHHAIAFAPFWTTWSGRGLDLGDPGVSERESIALFGYPISEPAMETNTSGVNVLTQWFERARFEYHNNVVELGLLGNDSTPMEILSVANPTRVAGGAIALAQTPALIRAAQDHANYLVRNFTNPGLLRDPYQEEQQRPGFRGRDVSTRVRLAGYPLPAEELIAFTSDPVVAVQRWLSNPRDRAILLNRNYQLVGIGYAPGNIAGTPIKVIVMDIGPGLGTGPTPAPVRSPTPITPTVPPQPSSTPTPQASIQEYTLPNAGSSPLGITSGPDGNIWFTEQRGNRIGRITAAGAITEFALPGPNSGPAGIAVGPDGNLWFAEGQANQIGWINPATGQIGEFPVPSQGEPFAITLGPDGNLWFVEHADRIGRITPAGAVEEFALAPYSFYPASDSPGAITQGPDGNLWFVENFAAKIGQMRPDGTLTEFALSASSGPRSITTGPDGNLWFTADEHVIGRISPTGAITTFPFPATGQGISAGPDGNLWFTSDVIGRITPGGAITTFELPPPVAESVLFAITQGPGGTLWYTSYQANRIGRIMLAR